MWKKKKVKHIIAAVELKFGEYLEQQTLPRHDTQKCFMFHEVSVIIFMSGFQIYGRYLSKWSESDATMLL